MIKADADLDPGLYRILEGGYGESAEDELVRNRPHIVLYERPHPLEFLPYSFDDHTESLRTKFRSRDISMQAIRLTPELPAYGGELPGNERQETPEGGAFRLGLIFDPGKSAEAQPILSTGRQGAGDEVFVQFLGPHAIRFGFDHWSQPATFSAPITCDLGEPHLLTISVAPLYPEPSRALPGGASSPLRNMVFLVFDGKSVLLRRIKCYPAIPRSIVLFHNFLGFSTAARDFSGRVLSVHRVSAEEIGREMTAGSLGSD